MQTFHNIDFRIDLAGNGRVGSEWSKAKFPYPHHRLYYVYSGEATLILNDAVHLLEPDNMYLIPAFSMVQTICEDHFYHHFVHFQLEATGARNLFTLYKPVFRLKASVGTKTCFRTIFNHYEDNTLYANMMTSQAFYSLLAPFFKDCQQPSSNFLRLQPVLNYIESNLEDKLTNGDLATIMDLDTVYFTNLFSRIIGQSPNQFIIRKRLERSQLLLTTTDLKVKEIAWQCGFDNHMYFSSLFKKKLNMTPTLYRKTQRNL